MEMQIRAMRESDVKTCGRICYEAFRAIAERHNFRPDFPSTEATTQLTQAFFASPLVYNVVAESGGRVIGANHLWEYDEARAVGPITVDPEAQAKGVGRKLMEAVIERGGGSRSIRLVQDSFNSTSLSLYASLGFAVREPLVMMEGEIKAGFASEIEVREIGAEDFAACAELSQRAHGFARLNELKNTPPSLRSFVALRGGRVTAYASSPHFWALNHAIAESEEEMRALLSGVSQLSNGQPLSFLLPTRQASLFRWCLQQGMRVIKPMNLMTMGEYQQPRACYLPSVGY